MAATQWQQQYQQPQHYQQPQQYAQGQPYQQPQQYQQHQHPQHNHPAQQYHRPQNHQPPQQFQQQLQEYPVQQQHQQNQPYQAQRHQQLQQGQSTQHYQQAQQGPLAQQYPRQQSHQLQQGHNGYQQQYAPQPYQSQQYATQQQGSPPHHGSQTVHTSSQQLAGPQQYGTSQYGTYQQACQPQYHRAQGPSPAQRVPQPCFNCGNSGHFAMDCPEPIREVPAGKANPQAFQNPLRRPKTAHQHTPNPAHPQVLPQGYPPPPHGQTGYPQNPQYQQAHSPATPLSAHSPAQAQYYQQWQQYYQSQQANQQGNQHHHHQGSPYHQQPYMAPHGQATGYANGSQTPSQASVQASQYTGNSQMYQSQFRSASASATPVQFNQQAFSNNATVQPDQRTQSSASRKSRSISPSTHKAQILDYDFGEDDLNSLDIPDLPQATLQFSNVSQQPVNLISQPLPANFIVADALAPFPQPASHDGGCCKSKYQNETGLEAFLKHFKDTKYWDKEHADDVAFSDLSADGKIIPVDDILLTIKQRHTHPESSYETYRDSRSQSRTVSMNQDSLEVKTSLDRMERELAETKAKLQAKLGKGKVVNAVHGSPLQSVKIERPHLQDHEIKEEYQTPPQSATSEKTIRNGHDTEDVLAALGVTGAPKPVTATPWPDHYTSHSSPHDMHMSRSRSSSRADILGGDHHRLQSDSDEVAPEHQANGSGFKQQNLGSPLPPPPVPSRRRSYPDGTHGSPHSAGLAPANSLSYNSNGVDHSNSNGNGNANANGLFNLSTDGQTPSSLESRSEKSISRKRNRDSSSDEADTSKRRQEDDYTPKLKKRQPKVAEAYSRRW